MSLKDNSLPFSLLFSSSSPSSLISLSFFFSLPPHTWRHTHKCHEIICKINSVQFSSLCVRLCNPMDRSTPGFPVRHHLPEQHAPTHVHRVGDAILTSHPLSSSFFTTFNLSSIRVFPVSQFFASGGQSIGVSASTSILPMNIPDWFPLRWTSWISLQSKGHRNTSRQKIGQLFLISLLRVKLSSENSWKKTHKLLIRSRLYVHL